MHKFIMGLIAKHLPTSLSIILSIGGSAYYLGEVGVAAFEQQTDKIIQEARQPTYLMLEYQILKQREKLNTNPDDLKITDIEHLAIQCNDDFGTRYVPELPHNRRVNVLSVCDEISNLYASRNVY